MTAAASPPAAARSGVPGDDTGASAQVVGDDADADALLDRLALALGDGGTASRGAARTAVKVWPATGPLTGWFSESRARHRHTGLDIDGSSGDPVVAAAAGRVVIAGPAPSGYAGYGRIVVIDHGDGTETLYAHLSSVATTAGATVAAGERIGAIGTSGNVTGSHLHFEVRVGGRPVDPAPWLPPR